MQKSSPKAFDNVSNVDNSIIFEKFQSLLKVGIWRYNFQTQEVVFDASFYEVIGYTSEDFKLKTLNDFLNLIHANEKEVFDFLKPPFFIPFSKRYTSESRIKHNSKNWIWVENNCEVLSFTANGEPEWLLGFIQDITETKNKEFVSIKNENLLNRTNEAASIGTWEVNLVDMTVSWSDVTKKIHGFDERYVPSLETGINFYKEGAHRDRITELFNACISEGKGFDDEFLIITEQGREKWVRSIGIAVMEQGTCVRVYGLFQDIDEKTRALQKIATTEEKLRKTFDFSRVGMAMVGIDMQWQRVNQSLCTMLGYTKEEFLQLKFKDFTHPEDLEGDKILLREALQGRVDDYTIDKRYLHKSGKVIWTILTVSVIRDDEGKPTHFVSQINDISKAKKSEEKVKNLLELTKDQNDRLLNFAHIVSHNLRSHSGNLEMLLDLIKIDNPEINDTEMFPLLQSAVDQLEETVQNLNEVAILNTKTEVNLAPLNLSNYVNNVITSINSIIIENSVHIENNVSSAIKVLAIPAYLDSLILNFLTNAIKYQSLDRSPKIKVDASYEKEYVVLSVTDNGLGIDLETYGKKLFGMYKTFHQHKDSRGLGLFITRNQIEAMGGKIEVRSEVNKGTTFLIYLQHEKN
ncbi:PAS domain-containing protein [Rasiella sp. SM2506]|uniref:PAS domain-containing sensor histidine kinase n=1 Tax=Rasiella sp. SM2506 TaxID=3423914 RepID=UPI003D7A6298